MIKYTQYSSIEYGCSVVLCALVTLHLCIWIIWLPIKASIPRYRIDRIHLKSGNWSYPAIDGRQRQVSRGERGRAMPPKLVHNQKLFGWVPDEGGWMSDREGQWRVSITSPPYLIDSSSIGNPCTHISIFRTAGYCIFDLCFISICHRHRYFSPNLSNYPVGAMAGLVAASSVVGACASLAGERIAAPARSAAVSVQVRIPFNLICYCLVVSY